ncbi:aspartyl protease family protein [Sphingorhabdus arenilitoris]|uniref:Aspartyl protease family protein n=1 Tax=Sphingorhabdus arenilitoris TaxID=1490041 RepID=A0ABV8RIC3_9SPHN
MRSFDRICRAINVTAGIAGIAAFFTPLPAAAADLPAEVPSETADNSNLPALVPVLQDFTVDRTNRLTVPVTINDGKSFPFIVDTGSERTVISQELAEYLNLDTGDMLRLATVSGPATVNSYLIDKLTTATISMESVEAPGLKRQNLGAHGLLGIDSLEENKIFLDFKKGEMQVLPSEKRRGSTKLERGMIVVTARRKAGRMILSNALVNGAKVDIIIDTGAQSSMGNYKLRDLLRRRDRKGDYQDVAMKSVIGDVMTGQFTQIRSIEIGGVKIMDLPITFSENYAMKTLGLENKPAIFLGMDALGLFDKVVIDFTNRRISFELPKGSSADNFRRLAAVR